MIKASTLSAIKGIRHGFFTREGGFSSGLYSSLNTGLGSQDDRETVKRNRAKICGELGVPTLVTPYQVHSVPSGPSQPELTLHASPAVL